MTYALVLTGVYDATGTIVGGFGGPLLFGALIESGDPDQIFIGYLVGAIVMITSRRGSRSVHARPRPGSRQPQRARRDGRGAGGA